MPSNFRPGKKKSDERHGNRTKKEEDQTQSVKKGPIQVRFGIEKPEHSLCHPKCYKFGAGPGEEGRRGAGGGGAPPRKKKKIFYQSRGEESVGNACLKKRRKLKSGVTKFYMKREVQKRGEQGAIRRKAIDRKTYVRSFERRRT